MNAVIPALAASLLFFPSPPATPSQQPTRALVRVRVRDDVVRESLVLAPTQSLPAQATGPIHNGHNPLLRPAIAALAWHGEPVPGGGTLDPVAFANPTTTGSTGRIAFFSNVSGSARNQGIFTATPQGLVPVVLGCGGGGGSGNPGSGCGDPSPIGGTFSGIFGGTVFAPASNPGGDLLFVADVDGGSSPRGLFLYRAATQTIVKVAAVGDPSPAGGTLGAIGPGSLNVQGDVAFLATGGSPNDHQILLWHQGVLTLVVRDGDPAPGGGVYQYVGSESFGFADGTSIPIGPLPDLNGVGQIAFRGIVTGGNVSRGIVVWQGGSSQWYVVAGDPTPSGGTFFDMQGATINDAGEVAFFADFRPTPTTFNSGWFVGSPGNWRTGLAFFDPVGGGQCFGLAFSRNPMEPLSNNGDLVLWTDVQMPGGAMVEHLVVRHANGQLETVARQGDASPLGGTLGTMDAWPSLNQAGSATVNAATPGASGGILSAHMLRL
jgi:hypothetical protein